VLLLPATPIRAQCTADPGFDTSVAQPAYTRTHPTVAIDEAHANFHTAGDRYKPLADLLVGDGYRVIPGKEKFRRESLRGIDVLIIANATAPDASDEISGPAFTEQECEAVRDWIRAGGSLLLIADHEPYGSAAEILARRFGVDMGKGSVFDFTNSDAGLPAATVFSRENGLLGSHPVLRGRNPSERIERLVAFTGQSLGVPPGAAALMKLGPTAHESPTQAELAAALGMDAKGKITYKPENVAAHARPVAGRAQAVAIEHGKGRVVIAGEAAMFSAQLIRYEEEGRQQEIKMGMNVPGNDDRQFALNVLHWLSGLLD
jgi:hypothetical protein